LKTETYKIQSGTTTTLNIEIEENISIPAAQWKKRSPESIYLENILGRMKYLNSITVSDKQCHMVAHIAKNLGYKIATRRMDEPGMRRVWMLSKKDTNEKSK
jgi:hypothetical protein